MTLEPVSAGHFDQLESAALFLVAGAEGVDDRLDSGHGCFEQLREQFDRNRLDRNHQDALDDPRSLVEQVVVRIDSGHRHPS